MGTKEAFSDGVSKQKKILVYNNTEYIEKQTAIPKNLPWTLYRKNESFT